ncbi:MAG: hypothetical protein LBT81_05465 [Helicobacteraceae bacterium]|nr:hypothetical protein [Helicobacteraceae bacterium]
MRVFRLLFLPLMALADMSVIKSIYLTHEPIPETLYVGQTIPVTYNVLITDQYRKLETLMGEMTGVKRVAADSAWQIVDENRRKIVIYYQITATRITFPSIEAVITLLDGSVDSSKVNSLTAVAQRIGTNPQFCGVVAEDLNVVSYKVERLNETQNILAMELTGSLSNLGSFTLGGSAQTQGFESQEIRQPLSRAFYYAFLDTAQSDVSFNYFNSVSGDFKRISLAFDLSNIDREISTHTDINPNKKSIPWMNLIVLLLVSITLIAVFFKTRKIVLLLPIVIVAALIVWIVVRDEKIIIKQQAQVRLLPTETSTLFYVTDKPTSAILLREKSGFVKVLLPDEKIGWVKKSEIE